MINSMEEKLAIYRFSAIPFKSSNSIFHRHRTNNPKFESKKTPKSHSNLEEEQSWRLHISLFLVIVQS